MDCRDYRKNHEAYSAYPLSKDVWDTPHHEAWQAHGTDCTSCADWTLEEQCRTRGVDPAAYPCVHMAAYTTCECAQHPDGWDCPDAVFRYNESKDEFAIGPRAGGGDPVAILFCPMCGVKLPASRRS